MNYLEQIKGFWIAHEVHQFSTSEIAMYFYLLEIWNKSRWIDTYYRNNYKVMSDLSIRSYKTLQSTRDRLKATGILVYRQRNGDASVAYEMANLCKFYLGHGECSEETTNTLGKKYQGQGKGSYQGQGKGSGKVRAKRIKPNINQTITSDSIESEDAHPQNVVDEKISAAKNSSSKRNSVAPRKIFKQPELGEVQEYFSELKFMEWPVDRINLQAQKFNDYYTANGWKVGRNPMKDWQATVRNWINNDFDNQLKRYGNSSNDHSSTAYGGGTGTTKTGGTPGTIRSRGAGIDELQALKRGGRTSGTERTEFTDAQVAE